MKDDQLYLTHILECIQRIESYTADGYAAFSQSQQIQDAVIRNFEIIGEAAKRISPGMRQAHPHMPWRQMTAFRDVLIHDYFGIDLDEVWQTIQVNLPDLKGEVEAALQKTGRDKDC